MTDTVEVSLTLGHLARVDHFSLCEKYELIEQSDDIAARLMDSEDDGTVVVSRERNEALHDVIGVIGVETYKVKSVQQHHQ